MRQNLPDIPGKQTQQFIFYRGETDLLPVKTGIAGGIVDGQGTVVKNGGCGIGRSRAEPPQRDPQPSQKLRNGKGFCQIVVRTGVQRVDFVGIFTPGADDDDGYIRPRADPADDFDAVQIRQSEIQKNNIRIMRGGADDRGLSGLCGEITIPLRFKRDGNQVLNRNIILHDQNQCFIHSVAPPPQAD